MRLPAALLALPLLAACVVPIPINAIGAAATADPAPVAGGAFGDSLNLLRDASGAGPIQGDARLMAAAQAYAEEMAATGQFSHTGQGGSSQISRARAAGCGNGYVAENIAWGQSSEAAAFAGWRASPEHLTSMVNPVYRVYGLGGAEGYYVLMFAPSC